MLDSEHAGEGSRSSVAVTLSTTGTIALFGGMMIDGVATNEEITGGVWSGGTAGVSRNAWAAPSMVP
jgi:hypothetical protein